MFPENRLRGDRPIELFPWNFGSYLQAEVFIRTIFRGPSVESRVYPSIKYIIYPIYSQIIFVILKQQFSRQNVCENIFVLLLSCIDP
jgi:hypothetical protein